MGVVVCSEVAQPGWEEARSANTGGGLFGGGMGGGMFGANTGGGLFGANTGGGMFGAPAVEGFLELALVAVYLDQLQAVGSLEDSDLKTYLFCACTGEWIFISSESFMSCQN